MRTALLLAPIFSIMVACAAPAAEGEEGDVGSSSEEAFTNVSCAMSRAEILDSLSGGRRTVIERGFTWLDARVPYSQSRTRGGYRTDCSGFISMSWQLEKSYTTYDFLRGAGENELLDTLDDLQPADGLVRRSSGSGHALLFLGWNDSDRTEACILEQMSTKSDMQFHVRTRAQLRAEGFHAMRADDITGNAAPVTPGSDTSSDDGSSSDTPAPSSTSDDSSATCTGDGDCNPGNNGTGRICSPGGQCVPGCHTSAQCPGSQTCGVSGQCE